MRELGGGELGVDDLLAKTLFEPIEEFLSRPSKKFRARLVEIGYRLGGADLGELGSGEKELCERAADAVESIHAGSLVVDDIQDGSSFRRGAPSLHESHGIPLALNAGNWLYFWPLSQMKLWGLDERAELLAYRLVHQALLEAHYGQALDVGVKIDLLPRRRLRRVCLASLQWKTGALTKLAIGLGGVLRQADDRRLKALANFGINFGVALQMFDDLGNLRPKQIARAEDPKRFEDLRLRRPTWVWVVLNEQVSEPEYQGFLKALGSLPEDGPLMNWLSQRDLYSMGSTEADTLLESAFNELSEELSMPRSSVAFQQLEALASELRRAYE